MICRSWDIPFEDTAGRTRRRFAATLALSRVDDFDLDMTCSANDCWPHPLRSELERCKDPDLGHMVGTTERNADAQLNSS
jgi:hypothetical protein